MPKGKDLLAFGEIKSIRQWSMDKRCKVPYMTLVSRLNNGMEADMAISTEQIDQCKMQIGDKINRLTLIEKYICKNKKGRTKTVGKFLCDCGEKYTGSVSLVYNQHVKSCGCLRIDHPNGLIHGKGGSKPLITLTKMIQRCYNTKNKRYGTYGGRGIRVYDEWKNNPINFYNWSIENGCADNLSIDRLDENYHYYPENCRWATHKQQLESGKNNRQILAWNEIKSTLHWTRDYRCKTDIKTIQKRLDEGWSTEDAIGGMEKST